jgi:aspartate-semialdehyde dehydrogenase
MKKTPVSILGATGMVGQRFALLLDGHPWFRVVALTGSDRSIGRTYAESCRWALSDPMPEYVREMVVQPTEPDDESTLAFSALPADLAREAEPKYAKAGKGICSNASAFRQAEDVPILIPDVNPDHTRLIEVQRKERGRCWIPSDCSGSSSSPCRPSPGRGIPAWRRLIFSTT